MKHAMPYLPERLASWGLSVWSAMVLLFLVTPILAVVPLSFSSGSMLTYPLPGLSMRWYASVLESDRWLPALGHSLMIGIAATILATVLGTLAALGLGRLPKAIRGLVMAVLLSPMIVPSIIAGVGIYFFFAPLGLTGSFLGLILAHTALAVPFVVVTVGASLAGFDTNLMRAGASLGAAPVDAFRRVMLPLILPGVASGAVFAFTTSFDEVVVALFLAGPQQRTLPREMFIGIREQISPEITALATMLIIVSTALLLTMEALRRRGERLRRVQVI